MRRPSAIERLAALYSFAFALAALILGVLIYQAMRNELRYELDQRVVIERDALLRESRRDAAALRSVVDERAAHGGQDMFYALSDGRGRHIAGSRPEAAPPLGWSEVRFRDDEGDADDARSIVTLVANGEHLIVGADPESIERLDDKMIPLFALVFGAIGTIGIGGAFLLSAALRRRLDAIVATANAITAGDLAQRMPVGAAGDEFDRLSTTLNRMLDRNAALMANLRQVSGDIAHDLRTPLTRLRHKLDLASATAPDSETLRAAIDEAGVHAEELLALFTAILDISAIEAGGGALRARPFDLSALVADIAESYSPAAEDGGRTLERDVAAGLRIAGQRELVAQLLVNLLDNALRHTAPGTRIVVSLAAAADRVVLTVADDGVGIDAVDRGRVFERFVRLERSRTSPGHGLGLRLVAAIAAAHDAGISLEDNEPGVRMTIAFPRSDR